MRITRALSYITLSLALACSGGGYGSSNTPTGPGTTGTGAPPTATTSVSVGDNSFSPASITVTPGATVTWTWAGRNPHSVTFDDGTTSATQSSGTYQRAFPTAGTFAYHCVVHGVAMSGTVTVK